MRRGGIPFYSATGFAETISSVFGIDDDERHLHGVEQVFFSSRARAARSVARSALRRLTSKPTSRTASTAPSSATAPIGKDGATLGKGQQPRRIRDMEGGNRATFADDRARNGIEIPFVGGGTGQSVSAIRIDWGAPSERACAG